VIDHRFLFYLVNTHSFLQLGAAEMYGVAGQQRVPDSFLRDFPIHLPPLEEQRRIADFLDAETAHIDQMIAARVAQLELLVEHEKSTLDGRFRCAKSAVPTRLKHLLALPPRYGVLVPQFVDDGVPFIRVNDLLDLEARAKKLYRIPEELSAQYARTIVRQGDLLISVVGTLGRTAVAPASLAGANVARAVCSIRVAAGVEVDLMNAWCRTSSFERQALAATSSDTAQPTLGMEDLKNFRIGWPSDPNERAEMLQHIKADCNAFTSLRDTLSRQRESLAERRTALITAAVTGQFEVSSASARALRCDDN
jgi:type I restriction enzyme S subunit